MKINGISSTNIARLNGRTLGASDKVFNLRVDGGSVLGQIFNVTDYGADSTGTNDSTDNFISALDAAGAVATSASPAGVYVPTGSYKVIPYGTLHLRFWEKASGTWSQTAGGDDPSDTKVGDFHVYDVAPTAGVGTDGDYYINRTVNSVYKKASGSWSSVSALIEADETDYLSDFYPPDDTMGTDGQVYIQYYLERTEAAGCVFAVKQAWNNVTLYGDGKDLSSIFMRCWGDISPLDFQAESAGAKSDIDGSSYIFKRPDGFWYGTSDGTETATGISMQTIRVYADLASFPATGAANTNYVALDTNYSYTWDSTNSEYDLSNSDGDYLDVVIRSAIPPEKWFPEFSGTNNSMSRGNLFVWKSDGTHTSGTYLDGFKIHDLELDGGTETTYSDLWYTLYHDLLYWDINHKGVTWSWGGDGPIYNSEVQRCRVTGFRGESLYAGGATTKFILIKDCEISHTNGSAISISGQLTVDGCTITNMYNGLENYHHKEIGAYTSDQYTTIRNTSFDQTTGGSYSIVFISEDGAGNFGLIEDCTINNGRGIFLSDFADNITIRRTTITDAQFPIYLSYMGLYSKPGHYRNLTLDDVTIKAVTRGCEIGIFHIQHLPATGWSFNALTFVEENAKVIGDGIRVLNNGTDEGFDLTITNSDLSVCTHPWKGSSTSLSPTWGAGNTVAWTKFDAYQSIVGSLSGTTYTLWAHAPKYYCNLMPSDIDVVMDPTLSPIGHTVEIKNDAGSGSLWFLADTGWNALSQDYELVRYDSITLQVNANQKYELVAYEEGKYTP